MEIINIVSITISVLLVGLLIPNIKNSKPNLFLIGILLIVIGGATVNILLIQKQAENYLYFISFVDALPSVFGLLLFYYVKHTIYPNTKLNIYHLLYLMPFFVAFQISLHSQISGNYNVFTTVFLHIVLKNFFSFYFIIRTILELKKYKNKLLNNYSTIEALEFKWLNFLTYIAFYFWIICLVLIIFIFSGLQLFFNPNTAIHIGLSIFVFTISIYGIYNSSTFSNLKVIDLQVKEFTPKEDDEISAQVSENFDYNKEFERIHNQILTEKLFLNQEFTIQDLSNKVKLHPKKCSEIINGKTNSNYFYFINTYRVNYFNEQIVLSENKNLTFLAVANNSGFKSKSTFNRAYKKIIGKSPSEYLNSLQK